MGLTVYIKIWLKYVKVYQFLSAIESLGETLTPESSLMCALITDHRLIEDIIHYL